MKSRRRKRVLQDDARRLLQLATRPSLPHSGLCPLCCKLSWFMATMYAHLARMRLSDMHHSLSCFNPALLILFESKMNSSHETGRLNGHKRYDVLRARRLDRLLCLSSQMSRPAEWALTLLPAPGNRARHLPATLAPSHWSIRLVV
jgi:hypothetical protein